MPKILLDATRLVSRLYNGLLPTGVDRVGFAYIERYHRQALAVLSGRGHVAVLTQHDSQHLFDLLLSTSRNKNMIRKLVVRGCILSMHTNNFESAHLLHTSHNGMEYSRYYHTMRRRGARTVFMVHDLIPITHSEYCRPDVDKTHRRRIHTALRYADGLIANSEVTLEALAAEANSSGLPIPPTIVARLAPGITLPVSVATSPLGAPYFVMLGTIEPRKNHWFMLHVWRRLVERHGSAAPKLVIIGRRGWECENVIDMLERCSSLRAAVIEIPQCTDAQLHAWLQGARALLFPSFVEGYGMPLVEALALRVPVLASDLPVFKEIAADIPDYLDPLDGPGWLTRIEVYARSDSLERVAQLERIKVFREPTWGEHFDHVDHFLATLH